MHFTVMVKMELPVNLFTAQEQQRKFANPKGIRAIQVVLSDALLWVTQDSRNSPSLPTDWDELCRCLT